MELLCIEDVNDIACKRNGKSACRATCSYLATTPSMTRVFLSQHTTISLPFGSRCQIQIQIRKYEHTITNLKHLISSAVQFPFVLLTTSLRWLLKILRRDEMGGMVPCDPALPTIQFLESHKTHTVSHKYKCTYRKVQIRKYTNAITLMQMATCEFCNHTSLDP